MSGTVDAAARAPASHPPAPGGRTGAGPAIALRGLGVSYGREPIFADVTLRVEPGELLALIGPSGSGKSTLLRCIAGFLAPAAGELAIGGAVVSTPERSLPPERRKIGYVFQAHALWPHMSARDNVAYPWKVRGVPAEERRRRAESLLARVGLAGLGARRPGELSGGERQRVALARALAGEPEILLLDEPFSSVDVMVRDDLLALVRALVAEFGLTTVFTTHDQQEATALADRAAVLVDGRLAQVGTTQEIYEAPVTSFVARFMGAANLLPAEVVTRVAGGTIVRPLAGGGAELLVPATTEAAQPVVMVRPEHVALVEEPGTPGALVAEVRRARPRGASTEIALEAAGVSWVALVPAGPHPEPGARVGIRLLAARLLER